MDDRPIARLRRLVVAMADLQAPRPDDAAWFIAASDRYEAAQTAGIALDLGAALGLGAPGRRSWWADECRARRDKLLRELRARYLPDVSAGQAATAILRLTAIVQAGGLQVTAGDARLQLLGEAMATGQAIPAFKQLKRLLQVDMNGPS